MKRLYTLAMLVIALLAFVAMACGDDDDTGKASGGALDTKNPFRIAVPADLTGLLASYSGNNANGAKAAAASINKQGGILGREVVLDIRDAASDPAKGSDIGKEMILSGKYQAIYAAVPFAAGLLAPEITKAKTLGFATSGDSRMADPKFSPFTFELPASPVDQAQSIACYVRTLPYKSVAIAAGDAAYLKAQRETWQKVLPAAQIRVTAAEETATGAKDVSAQFTKLKASNPEALLLDAGAPDLAVYFEAIKNLKWDIPVIGGNGFTTFNMELILKSLDDIPKNTTATAWAINVRKPGGLTPQQQKATSALKEQGVKIDQPLYVYAFGWDAIHLIKYAAETAKSDKGEAMAKALEGLGAVKDQSKLGTILAEHYDFSTDFHGLKSVQLSSVKGLKITDGLFEYGGKDWKYPC